MINKVPSWCKVWNKLRIQLAWYLYALNLAGLEGRCSTILNFCLLAVVSTFLGYCWISVQIVSWRRDQISRPFRRLHLELRDLSLTKDHNQLNFLFQLFTFIHHLKTLCIWGVWGRLRFVCERIFDKDFVQLPPFLNSWNPWDPNKGGGCRSL